MANDKQHDNPGVSTGDAEQLHRTQGPAATPSERTTTTSASVTTELRHEGEPMANPARRAQGSEVSMSQEGADARMRRAATEMPTHDATPVTQHSIGRRKG